MKKSYVLYNSLAKIDLNLGKFLGSRDTLEEAEQLGKDLGLKEYCVYSYDDDEDVLSNPKLETEK